VHPLVDQLRFTRSEFRRGLEGLSDAEARQRLLPASSISWNVGHLAWQEQRYFLHYAGGEVLFPEIDTAFAYRAPASTPPLDEVMTAWQAITAAADPWLDSLGSERLLEMAQSKGRSITSFGNLLQRTIYHYWYHNGENQAIRQQLGHTDLPQFVGDIDGEAPFRA
jgi:uncharacterized damage-inducible protein DinB